LLLTARLLLTGDRLLGHRRQLLKNAARGRVCVSDLSTPLSGARQQAGRAHLLGRTLRFHDQRCLAPLQLRHGAQLLRKFDAQLLGTALSGLERHAR
jgi:hypothetical protein